VAKGNKYRTPPSVAGLVPGPHSWTLRPSVDCGIKEEIATTAGDQQREPNAWEIQVLGIKQEPTYRKTEESCYELTYRKTEEACYEPTYRKTEEACYEPTYRKTESGGAYQDDAPNRRIPMGISARGPNFGLSATIRNAMALCVEIDCTPEHLSPN
jgi:hypothetical protein